MNQPSTSIYTSIPNDLTERKVSDEEVRLNLPEGTIPRLRGSPTNNVLEIGSNIQACLDLGKLEALSKETSGEWDVRETIRSSFKKKRG